MKTIKTAIIGGGAAGLFLATSLSQTDGVTIFERGERVGRKLSATGNGQGNVTNTNVKKGGYFGSSALSRVQTLIARYDEKDLTSHFEKLGVLLQTDERGRTYPAGRQASALTDALRFAASARGVELCTDTQIVTLEKSEKGFLLTDASGENYRAETVVLCTGGKAAKNFGTDGSAYALAQGFGHSVTPLFPSLVQLKTNTAHIKTLKGIRVANARATVKWQGGEETLTGDIIFTDYGVSGDAVFRLSAFIADKIDGGVTLTLDFLPDFDKARILRALEEKRKNLPALARNELLGGIVNNQIGRAVFKRAENDLQRAAALVKAFPLTVTGTLGFDYAQVTKGGVPMSETDENLQSRFVKDLYFAGEILDVDGACGGYNLQWAFTSARTVATAIDGKERGQV